jgi:hypothetical protein
MRGSPTVPATTTPTVANMPGAERDWLTYRLKVRLFGGSAETGLFEYWDAEPFLSVVDGEHVLTVVRRVGRDSVETRSLESMNFAVAGEKTRDDSREYAIRLAARWHAEQFVFDCWTPGKRRWHRQIAQWRYTGSRTLEVYESDRRWQLKIGSPIVAPGVTQAVLPLGFRDDRWDVAYRQIEQACGTFAELTGALPPGAVQDQVVGARDAVTATLREAQRLADVGRKLTSTNAPALAAKAEQIAARLTGLHAWTLDVVAVLADVHMEFPSDAASAEPSERLAALVSGLTEVRAITG